MSSPTAHESPEAAIRASTDGRESRGMPLIPVKKALQNVGDRLRDGVKGPVNACP
jgi:hypothetical protein